MFYNFDALLPAHDSLCSLHKFCSIWNFFNINLIFLTIENIDLIDLIDVFDVFENIMIFCNPDRRLEGC